MRDLGIRVVILLIVLGLWGLLLHPIYSPTPARAADGVPGTTGTMIVTDRGVYVRTEQGHIFVLDTMTLAVKARAIRTVDRQGNITFQSSRP